MEIFINIALWLAIFFTVRFLINKLLATDVTDLGMDDAMINRKRSNPYTHGHKYRAYEDGYNAGTRKRNAHKKRSRY